jgi:hypothetical protein
LSERALAYWYMDDGSKKIMPRLIIYVPIPLI